MCDTCLIFNAFNLNSFRSLCKIDEAAENDCTAQSSLSSFLHFISFLFNERGQISLTLASIEWLDKFSSGVFPKPSYGSLTEEQRWPLIRGRAARNGAFCVLVRLASRCELFRFLVNKRACSSARAFTPPRLLSSLLTRLYPSPPLVSLSFFLSLPFTAIRDSSQTHNLPMAELELKPRRGRRGRQCPRCFRVGVYSRSSVVRAQNFADTASRESPFPDSSTLPPYHPYLIDQNRKRERWRTRRILNSELFTNDSK